MKKLTLSLLLFFSFQLVTAQEYHTLKRGETLYQLSRSYNVSVDELRSANGIADVTDISAGTRILIPGITAPGNSSRAGQNTAYRVRAGDTLYGIARSHGLSVDELLQLNGIDSSRVLRVGDELVLSRTGTPMPTEVARGQSQEETVSPGTPWFWPHEGKRIALDGKLMGKEISGTDGDPVVSVSSGKVIWVAPYHGYGKIVMVESPDKHIFAYGGNSDTLVDVGDFVKPGQKLGLVGSNGRDSLPKVYFFVYKNGKPVDPEAAPRK